VWLAVGGSVRILILFKFLLPNWQPHKKWLGGLMGFSLAGSLASLIYGICAVVRSGESAGNVIAGSAIRGLWDITIINPYFYLLIGIAINKSTEKIPAIVYSIDVAFVLFMSAKNIAAKPVLLLYSLPDFLIVIGYIILYFTWPVLTRPILEKENTFMKITFEKNLSPKQKPDQSALGFGNYFTDHMFLMNYDEGEGWHDPRIVPYGPIALDPSAMCLHYGQEVFEGLKAYCGVDGNIRLFRPEENMARLNLSNERLCIPPIDEAFAVHATEELVKVDRDWIPTADGTSLYIRPFIFAVDPQVGVHPAAHLIFCIILSPVGAYYPEGLNPVKIFVEEKYVRAVKGGLGFTKAAANYASSLKAQQEAQAQGYSQVLWLDGVERKYIEEVGTMNVFFAFENEIVTPALQGSILSGITRKSCIDILRSWGYTVNERPLALEEVVRAAKSGALKEAFGSGTAAVVSPIGALACGGETLTINNGEIGAISQKLYDELTGIQWGTVADTRGWTRVIG
jgi:branched-chain amino acid aminotransferase